MAADALGYARQSRTQILALARAARDPDDEVRNNATRALSVLASSGLAIPIPTDTFIEMLNSGRWTDRNKATALLDALTVSRNPGLLQAIRSRAMALGRVAGLPEERLRELAWNGPVESIVAAAGAR
ncbi:MAG: hypothetical protein KIT09_30295 [Bryobacteraceae bacterium]|nr:hypothetical protein [Bryobacteraceae bacterium]